MVCLKFNEFMCSLFTWVMVDSKYSRIRRFITNIIVPHNYASTRVAFLHQLRFMFIYQMIDHLFLSLEYMITFVFRVFQLAGEIFTFRKYPIGKWYYNSNGRNIFLPFMQSFIRLESKARSVRYLLVMQDWWQYLLRT